VLDSGKSLMLALSQDVQQNRPVEAREHIRRFHELFFTLSPDKSAIESNVQRALYLSDESAIGYYRNLQEKGYFNRMIAGNISQTLTVDSIGGGLQQLSLRDEDLLPAAHHPFKQCYRKVACHHLPSEECDPERQQSAGFSDRGFYNHRKQGHRTV